MIRNSIESCPCKKPFSSAICHLCCRYGSIEQRQNNADTIITNYLLSKEEYGF